MLLDKSLAFGSDNARIFICYVRPVLFYGVPKFFKCLADVASWGGQLFKKNLFHDHKYISNEREAKQGLLTALNMRVLMKAATCGG